MDGTSRSSLIFKAAMCIVAGACTTCLTALLPAGWHHANSFGVIPGDGSPGTTFIVWSDFGVSEAILGSPPPSDELLQFSAPSLGAMRYSRLKSLIDNHTDVVFAKVAGFPFPSFSGYVRFATEGDGDLTWTPRSLIAWLNRSGRIYFKTSLTSAYIDSTPLKRHWIPFRTDVILCLFNISIWTLFFCSMSMLHKGVLKLRCARKLAKYPYQCPRCDYPLGRAGLCSECGWHR